MDGEEDWGLWRNYVLEELKRINGNVEKLADSDVEMKIDIANLKLVAAIIGASAGIGGAIVGAVITAL